MSRTAAEILWGIVVYGIFLIVLWFTIFSAVLAALRRRDRKPTRPPPPPPASEPGRSSTR